MNIEYSFCHLATVSKAEEDGAYLLSGLICADGTWKPYGPSVRRDDERSAKIGAEYAQGDWQQIETRRGGVTLRVLSRTRDDRGDWGPWKDVKP